MHGALSAIIVVIGLQYTTLMVEKARKRLYIMTKPAYLDVSESLCAMAYTSFIVNVLSFHLTTTYSHLSANDLKMLSSVLNLQRSR